MITTMSTDTAAAVRTGEELDRDRLSGYLRDKIEGGGQLTIEQFPGGHSNLTYLLRTPVREYVLRRGPLGPVAPKAHDMAREYMVLKAVHPVFAPAPQVFHLCEDTSIAGAIFFVMERRRGIVVRDHIPESPAPALVHNDFKLDNLMLDAGNPARIEAVLDWEMATVGDPLVDLGLILCYWSQPSDPGGTKPSITSQPGWFTREQLIGRYAAK